MVFFFPHVCFHLLSWEIVKKKASIGKGLERLVKSITVWKNNLV